MSNHISLLSPLLVGLAAAFCTVIVHGLMIGVIIARVRRDFELRLVGVRFWSDLLFVAGVTLLAFAAHLLEIGLWALVLKFCGVFSDFALCFYYSAVNYTSLGDNPALMAARWRLLGALEAGDGMLMFGVSTAMIFAVIQRLIQSRFTEPPRLDATR